VQRIARLKSDYALPATLSKQDPSFSWRQDELSIFRMLGLRQDTDLASHQHGARIVHHHVPARMIGPLGAVDALQIAFLVKRKNVGNYQRTHRLIMPIDQRYGFARPESSRWRLIHWE